MKKKKPPTPKENCANNSCQKNYPLTFSYEIQKRIKNFCELVIIKIEGLLSRPWHVHDIERECVASCDMRVAHETGASFLHLLPSNRCLLLINSPTIPQPVTHWIRSFIVVHSTQLLSSSKFVNKSTFNFGLNQFFVRNWPVKQVLPQQFFFN